MYSVVCGVISSEADCQRAVKAQVHCETRQKDFLPDGTDRQIQEVEIRAVSGEIQLRGF